MNKPGRRGLCEDTPEQFATRKRFSRHNKQLKRMEEDRQNGTCCFCDLSEEETILHDCQHWVLLTCPYPYEGTAEHLLIIPKRHITSLGECDQSEIIEYLTILKKVETIIAHKAYSIAIRCGKENAITGATQPHLHIHVVVPKGTQDIIFHLGRVIDCSPHNPS